MKRNTVHAELFRLTQPWHHQLDTHPALAVLLAPGLRVQAYGRVLQQLHACLQPCENALVHWEKDNPLSTHSAYQPRCPALVLDLAVLELPLLELPLLPGGPALEVESDAACLGLRYVLEGAALGSARIRQLLQQQAPDLSADSMHYLAAQQAQVAQWPKFLQQLERVADTDVGLAVDAAVSVFTHFLDVLDRTANDRHKRQ